MRSLTRGSLAVLVALVMTIQVGVRSMPSVTANGNEGHIWLDCDPGARARGGGWQAGGVVCLPGPYEPNAVLEFDLIVMNRGSDDLASLEVFLAIHGPGVDGPPENHPEFETTTDDMASVAVETQSFVIADFSNTLENPFDEMWGGRHSVYVGDDAIWTAYMHAPEVLLAGETIRLHVTVVLGPNPSPLFEIHFDAWDKDTNEKTPNGHDVTLISRGTQGNQPPEACFVFIPGDVVYEGDLATMDASCSSDPDGKDDIVSYEWDFDVDVDSDGDGITDNDINAVGPYVNFIWFDDYKSTVKLTVADSKGNADIAYGTVTILNLPPEGKFEGGLLEIELCIRMAGSKWSNAEAKVWENYDPVTGRGDRLLADIEVERWPGPPDQNPTSTGDSCVPLILDVAGTYNYTAVVTYDPFPDNGDAIMGDQPNNGKDPNNNAGNPLWLICKFPDGTECKWHHTFNTQQSMIRDSNHWNHVEPWLVPLNFGLVAGAPMKFMASATDPGTDDLTFDWDWGDGSTDSTTYLYDGIRGPDPTYPPGSPYEPYAPPLGLNDPAPPVYATNTMFHTYATPGDYTVTLTITDDDGGVWTYQTTMTVVDTFCK
jgi:hypothetical protein